MHVTAAWFTEKVFPATVALPDRAAPVLAAHDTVTDPGPVPLIGDAVSHDPLPAADQFPSRQPDGTPVIVTTCVAFQELWTPLFQKHSPLGSVA